MIYVKGKNLVEQDCAKRVELVVHVEPSAPLTRVLQLMVSLKSRRFPDIVPKYSPDLNPIEMPYSKFKTFLRKVAARTIPSLNRAIRSFIPQLSPQECANYFRHSGYVSI